MILEVIAKFLGYSGLENICRNSVQPYDWTTEIK
jgi:hypothetical protein